MSWNKKYGKESVAMKRFLFDFGHPAHINFFKPVITRLKKEGHYVEATVLNRGEVPKIFLQEYPDLPYKILEPAYTPRQSEMH